MLTSGLSRDDAMALERLEIARLPAALNVQNATTRAICNDPAQGAVARYYRERERVEHLFEKMRVPLVSRLSAKKRRRQRVK